MKTNIFSITIFLLSLFILNCSGNGDNRGKAAKPSSGDQMKFKTYHHIDRQGTGIEAFSLLMPVDWIFEGGILWLLDNPGMPATAALKVRNPEGTEEFEVFPNQPFFWTTNVSLFTTNPPGTKYFGNTVRKPLSARDALKKIVLKRFRGNVQNLSIKNIEDVPELAQLASAGLSQEGVSGSAEGAKMRIEYTYDGKVYDEEIYAAVEKYVFPIQAWGSIVYNTHWTVDYIFSFKAEKGKLEQAAKPLQTIVFSFTLNPAWYNKYVQLVEMLIKQQIQQIRSVGELGRMLAQTSSQIREENLKSYYERQAASDRIAENFSDYIRGVERYYDPIKGENVELPSGYKNVWTNASGEYILTEQLDYNPNVGSNVNWQRIELR